jgi:hypothetical protein
MTKKIGKKKTEGEATPLQAWRGPKSSKRLNLPEFLDSQHM